MQALFELAPVVAFFIAYYFGGIYVATAVLMAERPTVTAVMRTLATHQPTLFAGVPTLFAAMLADPSATREAGSHALRFSISAGEALPAELYDRWKRMDGIF